MDKEMMLTKGTLAIKCRLTEPEDGDIRRVVLGVHGLGGSSMDGIQRALAEEMDLFYGATLQFDFPAHGESPVSSEGFNLQNCIDSLMTVAAFAKERYPRVEDLCIFATGFGAYITLLCLDELMELPGRVKLVVQTPSVLMHETILSMGRIDETLFRALGKIAFRAERPLEVSYSFYKEMKENVPLNGGSLPFLILQGEEDAYVSMMQIQHLRRIHENAKLVIIPGVSHRFLEEGAWDMVLDLTRDWFAYEQVLVTDWE